MEDWRLTGQEQYLQSVSLIKLRFPDFWKKAYAEKNNFYTKIVNDAVRFVKEHRRGEEYLEGERVQAFWHEHCEFCWEKLTTDMDTDFYCTEDFYRWICPTCFQDFREKFQWKVK